MCIRDNLLSVDMVLADGRLVNANAKENKDLFWALRGGGGNFGVVTSFEYRLHPVSTVLGGMIVYRAAKPYRSCVFIAHSRSRRPRSWPPTRDFYTRPKVRRLSLSSPAIAAT